jgi:hypothetical protein
MEDYGESTKTVVGAAFPSDLPELPCGGAFVPVHAGSAVSADRRASVSALQPGSKYGSKKGVDPTDRFGATAQTLCTARPAIGVAAPTGLRRAVSPPRSRWIIGRVDPKRPLPLGQLAVAVTALKTRRVLPLSDLRLFVGHPSRFQNFASKARSAAQLTTAVRVIGD